MNVSIRTKILVGVVMVNLLGTLVAMVYLHQSYGGGVETTATRTVALALASYEQVQVPGQTLDPTKDAKGVNDVLGRMKAITGADYAFMLEKSATTAEEYSQLRKTVNLPNNWDEGETFALLAATDDAAADRMRFNVNAGSVPETGKTVGVENGACSQTCHNSITADGDYWGVAWSTDSQSRAHAVFPVTNAAGSPIGVVYAIEDISAQANEARTSMMRTLIVIGATLFAATLAIGAMVDMWIFKRLNRMMVAIEDVSIRVAGGDFDAHFNPDASRDEIGQFEQFFANVLDLMTGTFKSLLGQKSA